jgi:hypothetical protein
MITQINFTELIIRKNLHQKLKFMIIKMVEMVYFKNTFSFFIYNFFKKDYDT